MGKKQGYYSSRVRIKLLLTQKKAHFVLIVKRKLKRYNRWGRQFFFSLIKSFKLAEQNINDNNCFRCFCFFYFEMVCGSKSNHDLFFPINSSKILQIITHIYLSVIFLCTVMTKFKWHILNNIVLSTLAPIIVKVLSRQTSNALWSFLKE